MKNEGNIWKELWDSQQPVPSDQQEPLFDNIMQGEYALDYLENLIPIELIGDLMPVFFLIGFDQLNNQDQLLYPLNFFHQAVDQCETQLSFGDYSDICFQVCSMMEDCAFNIQKIQSLRSFFNEKEIEKLTHDQQIIISREILERFESPGIVIGKEAIFFDKTNLQRFYFQDDGERNLIASSIISNFE